MIFDQKTLLLTGASGGISQEIARIFYDEGANLMLADINEAALSSFAQSLGPDSKRVKTFVVDTSSSAGNAALVAACQDQFGGIDFLIPAAGIYPEQTIAGMTDEQWRKVISINLDGVFYLIRSAIPSLKKGGSIVNIASLAGHRGSHSHAHYSATKGALISLTRSLALELAPDIRVNAVSPGIIETPMVAQLFAQKGEQLLAGTPLKRLGSAREVASVVKFLCSADASFVTGEVIHVNGGLYMD